MIGLHFERALEVVLRAIEIAVVEKNFAKEKAQFVIVAIEFERLFQSLDASIRIERIDGRFGIGEQLAEAIALLSAKERNDSILPLHEALLFFESEHLLAHLRFPELDELICGNDVLLFEELLD